MKWILIVFISSTHAIASEAGAAGVPTVVFYQVLNLGILIAMLTFFLKDKVRVYFASKRENYLKAASEAQEVKKRVEEQSRILREKIAKLDSTMEATVQKAEADALIFNQKLVDEARQQAEKLKKETEKTVEAEIHKAIDGLKSDVIDQAIVSSRELIRTQLKDSDQKRLQNEFVEKIRVVET